MSLSRRHLLIASAASAAAPLLVHAQAAHAPRRSRRTTSG